MSSENEDFPAARFEIKHFEVHVGTAEVEARSTAEAIKRFLEGDGDMVNGSEYEGPCQEKGMSLVEHPELAEELRQLGVQLRGLMLPTIRHVRRLSDTNE